MSNLQRFLDWFEGYDENIEGAPTPKQWERIRLKIADLSATIGDEPEVRATASRAHEEELAPKKPKTTAQWTAQAKAFLIEHGFDPESADAVLEDVTPDLSLDPIAIAREAAGPAAFQ